LIIGIEWEVWVGFLVFWGELVLNGVWRY